MPRPHKPSAHEIELQRKIDALQIRLLQLNATLRLKVDYCRQLEWFVHRRNDTIDTLRAKLEQTTHRIQQLDIENTCLTTLIAASLDNDRHPQAHIETRPEAP